MKNIIGVKTNKVLVGPLITISLIICLITVCIIRLITTNLGIMNKIIIIGFVVICSYYFIKELIFFINIIKTPKDLLIIENDQLIINKYKSSIKININEITDIIVKENKKILFYQSDLIIKTNDKEFIINNIKDLTYTYNILKGN